MRSWPLLAVLTAEFSLAFAFALSFIIRYGSCAPPIECFRPGRVCLLICLSASQLFPSLMQYGLVAGLGPILVGVGSLYALHRFGRVFVRGVQPWIASTVLGAVCILLGVLAIRAMLGAIPRELQVSTSLYGIAILLALNLPLFQLWAPEEPGPI